MQCNLDRNSVNVSYCRAALYVVRIAKSNVNVIWTGLTKWMIFVFVSTGITLYILFVEIVV